MIGKKIRVLIADDEALARRGIRRLLAGEDDFEIQAEVSNGVEAMSAIAKFRPDLVFLDIQMPLMDGLSLVSELDQGSLPEIVFITAFDEHAISAFETGAIDYVLKPINPVRFVKTLDRVRRRRASGKDDDAVKQRLADLLKDIGSDKERYLARIAVRRDERIRFLDVDHIDWIHSQGNYLEIHSNGDTFLIRDTMIGITKRLNPKDFLRIRHSTIVRVDRIKELQTLFSGEYAVILKDGTELTTSRRYRRYLEKLLRT